MDSRILGFGQIFMLFFMPRKLRRPNQRPASPHNTYMGRPMVGGPTPIVSVSTGSSARAPRPNMLPKSWIFFGFSGLLGWAGPGLNLYKPIQNLYKPMPILYKLQCPADANSCGIFLRKNKPMGGRFLHKITMMGGMFLPLDL